MLPWTTSSTGYEADLGVPPPSTPEVGGASNDTHVDCLPQTARRNANMILSHQTIAALISDESLESLLQQVIKANNRGVSASKNISSGPNWSFGQSFFFSATVVTTIGEQQTSPELSNN